MPSLKRLGFVVYLFLIYYVQEANQMDNNLVSLNYLIDQPSNLEGFSILLNGEVPSEISEFKSSVSNFFQESALFMENFSQQGWCSMKVWTLI